MTSLRLRPSERIPEEFRNVQCPYDHEQTFVSDFGGVNYAYVTDNSKPDLLVFVHGLGASLTMFGEVRKDLKCDFSLLLYDLFGHALSNNPDIGCTGWLGSQNATYGLKFYANQLLSLMMHLGICIKRGNVYELSKPDRTVTICGFSLGGAIAVGFAYYYPELASRLVLISAAGFIAEKPMAYRILRFMPCVLIPLASSCVPKSALSREGFIRRKRRRMAEAQAIESSLGKPVVDPNDVRSLPSEIGFSKYQQPRTSTSSIAKTSIVSSPSVCTSGPSGAPGRCSSSGIALGNNPTGGGADQSRDHSISDLTPDEEYMWRRLVWTTFAKEGSVKGLLSTINNFPLFDMTKYYKKVGAHDRPVLLVWGADDILNPWNVGGRKIYKLMKNSYPLIVPDAGHVVVTQQDRVVANAIRDFCRLPVDHKFSRVDDSSSAGRGESTNPGSTRI